MQKDLLNFIKDMAKKYYGDENLKIYLFGSRARGDNQERSDWDLALDAKQEIVEFVLAIKEDSPTLCGVDIIYLPKATDELKEVVQIEGKLIYEQ